MSNVTLDTKTPQENAPMRLDDEQRVKVLSPGMMVFKRFIRNRLAIVGIVILISMFLFSFLGGILMPYKEGQTFKKYEYIPKDYAGAVVNAELRYTAAQGQKFSNAAAAKFILAVNKKQTAFSADGKDYTIVEEGKSFFRILINNEAASILALGGKMKYQPIGDAVITDTVKEAFESAVAAKQTSFSVDGVIYAYTKVGKGYTLSSTQDCAIASMLIYDAFNQADNAVVSSFSFRLHCEKAIQAQALSFLYEGLTYTLAYEDGSTVVHVQEDGATRPYASISNFIVNPIATDVFLTVGFKTAFRQAISDGVKAFAYTDENGVETAYTITLVNTTYTAMTKMESQLLDMYAYPSGEHWLGTDSNGMDVMTRLMYGGRVSLLVGFVVVFIEMFIGIIIGGVSGYFGKKIDTFLMRFVDLFNCIPFWPMVIIAGAVMDTMEVPSNTRIFFLMFILGILGWTGVARVVRGQILSLREQDFMTAAEATGISVSRRIFRHLVPNVMPLLIVQATMSLGGIIITEATLSFLGLGVKYPLASWGSIINAATDIHVMTNFWFIWIPAGLLILLTVLGFNFVGDGLRDAFDPKMKR